jgi:hypothetical protein
VQIFCQRSKFLSMCTSALVAWACVAQAELYQWTQKGTVVSFSGRNWNSSVSNGTPFSETLIFDDAVEASNPNGPLQALYEHAPQSAMLSFGDYTFRFQTYPEGFPQFVPTISVHDNYNGEDGYGWFWPTPEIQHGVETPFTWGMLLSSDLSLIAAPSLNIQQFDVSRFDVQHNRQFNGYFSGELVWVNFDVGSYSIDPVPEPGTVSLLGLGIAVGLWVARGGFKLTGKQNRK